MASLPGLLPRTSGGRVLLRTSALAIVVLLSLFAGASIALQHAISGTLRYDQAVRQVELYRSYLLRLQLDEETGLRGFALTRNRAYLLPLRQARARFPSAAHWLDSHLLSVDPAMLPALAQEESLNAQWLARIMAPMVLNPRLADDRALQQQGKNLIDRYRAINIAMGTSLKAVADAADRAANLLITRIALWSILFGIVLALALILYAGVQARLVQELDERTQSYERERRTTAALQQAFLFEKLPSVKGIALDATYLSAQEELRIGGDWYGVFSLPDGRIFFTLGDVAGHGTEAAVLMSRARQSILSSAVHESDPAVVLAKTNDVLRLRAPTMVTAICGFIDPETCKVTYASAGHPPPLEVTHGGEAAYLPHEGLPLGVMSELGCRTFTYVATPGSTLVLYTDGILEFDRNILSGEERLRAAAGAVMESKAEHPASAILERVLGGALQADDVAILTIHFIDDAAETSASEQSRDRHRHRIAQKEWPL